MTRRAFHHDWLCSVSFSFKLTMLIFSCNTVLNITMVISHLLHEETGSDRDEDVWMGMRPYNKRPYEK